MSRVWRLAWGFVQALSYPTISYIPSSTRPCRVQICFPLLLSCLAAVLPCLAAVLPCLAAVLQCLWKCSLFCLVVFACMILTPPFMYFHMIRSQFIFVNPIYLSALIKKKKFLQCVLNQGLTLQVDTPTMTSARVTHLGDTPGGHPGVTPLLFHCLRGNCLNRMQLHMVPLSGEHIFSLSKYMFTKYFIL